MGQREAEGKITNVAGAAIVTGSSSGIGLEIAKTLCRLGYEVYGFGRDFSDIRQPLEKLP